MHKANDLESSKAPRGRASRLKGAKNGLLKSKASNHEQDLRVSEVYEQIVQGMPTRAILQFCAGKWGIRTRAGEYLIAKARQELIKNASVDREFALALELELRTELLRLALESGKLQIALNIADSRARLQGLFDRVDAKVSSEIITIVGTGFET